MKQKKTIEELVLDHARRIGDALGRIQNAMRHLPRLLEGLDPASYDGKVAAEALLQLREAEAVLNPAVYTDGNLTPVS